MDNKIISIIPARGGSKGIPNKNIYPVNGKPLISWTLEQSLSSSLIDHTFISTNDFKIASIGREYNIPVIPRPEEISGDCSTTDEAIVHALNYLKSKKNIEPTIVIILQPTSPLRKFGDIDNSINKFISDNLDSLFSVSHVADLTIWEKSGKEWDSVNFDYKKRSRRQERAKQYIENGSIYIVTPQRLFSNNNIISGKIGVYKMDLWQLWEIDTIEEVEIVEFFLRKKYH